MKIRKNTVTNSAEPGTRDEVRALAEALGLWRSAMHHVAAQSQQRPRPAALPAPRSFRLSWLLAPALCAAIAAGVLLPLYSHLHHPTASESASGAVQPSGPVRASTDDTALMNQIDSELSEDVPDALRPLADLSSAASTNNRSATENQHVTQE